MKYNIQKRAADLKITELRGILCTVHIIINAKNAHDVTANMQPQPAHAAPVRINALTRNMIFFGESNMQIVNQTGNPGQT